ARSAGEGPGGLVAGEPGAHDDDARPAHVPPPQCDGGRRVPAVPGVTRRPASGALEFALPLLAVVLLDPGVEVVGIVRHQQGAARRALAGGGPVHAPGEVGAVVLADVVVAALVLADVGQGALVLLLGQLDGHGGGGLLGLVLVLDDAPRHAPEHRFHGP